MRTPLAIVLLSGAVVSVAAACSSAGSGPEPGAATGGRPGSEGTSTGGSGLASTTGSGGAPGAGGLVTTGGAQAAGGTSARGGASSGGAVATGGSTTSVGGAGSGGSAGAGSSGGNAAGGSTASGGSAAVGGAAAGGAGTGGATARGGTVGAGGKAAGGGTGVGGSRATGGSAAGGATGTGGGTGAGGGGAGVLDQSGSPLHGIVNTYGSWLSTASGDAAKLAADQTLADNMLTWQMPHGGWFKYGKSKYASPWNGADPRADWTGAGGVELGTIDNGGTVNEIMFLADVYRRSGSTKYRDAARKGMDFLLTMQYPSGGFPQVYPERPNSYSNYVTFNDNAMVRVLGMLDAALAPKLPFTADTFSSTQLAKLPAALGKAVGYILDAQIVQNGVKTVWCAQHDPSSHAPLGARSYELPSKSGNESVGVVAFLLSQPQTPEVKAAAQAAIAWYESDAVKVANTAYVSRPSGNTDDSYNPIQTKAGSTMWYRFYDLDRDVGFFSGRLPTDNPPGVGKKYDIMEIEAERRYGYQWGGAYGTSLFAYTDKIGY